MISCTDAWSVEDYMQLDSAERFDPMHGTWEATCPTFDRQSDVRPSDVQVVGLQVWSVWLYNGSLSSVCI